MEMNTRLQVEHPVTEEITGQDLVEWQLRVASGEPLPKRQDELSITGHAMEARLYAEDPAKGFLPSVGRLEHFDLGQSFVGGTVWRVDAGVEEGDSISAFYDPMIAKLIVHAADREVARDALAGFVGSAEVWPVRTNAGFLFNALLAEDFAEERISTAFIEQHLDELVPDPEPDEAVWNGAASVATALSEEDASAAPLAGFRLNASARHVVALGRGGAFRTIDLSGDESVAAVSGFRDDERVVVFEDGQAYQFALAARGSGASHGLHDGEIAAPMPGKVTAVEVSAGESVAEGQRLLTLEAMKMEHALTAPFDGVIAELNAAPGAQVTEGQLLVKVEPAEQ
jgi:3-methylcrotonyl-CoA carboxylase alpha subunit